MSSNTENHGNLLNNLYLTNEQKKKYRKQLKAAQSQNEINKIVRNATLASNRGGKNIIKKVANLNIRGKKSDLRAVAKIADKGASIVARLIEGGHGNDAMIVLVFGLVSLVGSDRLVVNAIRSMPAMRPKLSARGPVNYAFKRSVFELQKFFADVQTPYLYWREELLATYGPNRASFLGKSMDVAIIAMTFMYLAVRVGRFSSKFIEVVGPSLHELYKRIQDQKMGARVLHFVLNFYWQVAQEQMSLNRKTMAGVIAVLSKLLMKGRNPTQNQTINAIQTVLNAIQGAPVSGQQARQVINYVQQQNAQGTPSPTRPTAVSPGGTILTTPARGGGKRPPTLTNVAQQAEAEAAFRTPPPTPVRIRAVGPNRTLYTMTKNQWNRLPTSRNLMTTRSNDPIVELMYNRQMRYARRSNLQTLGRSRP
jgi:hypothetical protein